MTWRDDALCRNAPLKVFFPAGKPQGTGTSKPDYRPAQRICALCPVREACLSEAMLMERTNGGRHGVWGGLTPDERAALARVRQR